MKGRINWREFEEIEEKLKKAKEEKEVSKEEVEVVGGNGRTEVEKIKRLEEKVEIIYKYQIAISG